MLYLLDADVLIKAKDTYYAFDRVPEFWEWLIHMARQDNTKIPFEIYKDITNGNDILAAWVREKTNKEALVLDEEINRETVSYVLERGYAPDLDDVELEKIGSDPFLIGYAHAANDRCVVTMETSRPRAQRANRKIPDVCKTFGITCIDTFAFLKALNFSTSWRP